MDFFKKKGPLMNYHIFRSPHLANKYCVTEEVAGMIAKTPLGYGNDEEDQPHDISSGAPSWLVIDYFDWYLSTPGTQWLTDLE
ncbi:uncharacterized protein EV420DRAFT_1646029 [Desarmillaria tabescens]|uniref:Uncharacterized protein n=1 Tax=Armillaria tabescens TaxID=1929756 RepID=A0AA39JYI4_ARMTA|nr:uncharacterized protein EV420DRAFT_1646029 [Desarmillaria tabescens]KAK0451285.1 hypothetical protein EV420DRAFT_1646029 [Desarmillaria tabescens]